MAKVDICTPIYLEMLNLFRTVLETIVATLVIGFAIFAFLGIYEHKYFSCQVGAENHQYLCAGHPQPVYICVLIITMIFLAIYLFCSIWGLIWLYSTMRNCCSCGCLPCCCRCGCCGCNCCSGSDLECLNEVLKKVGDSHDPFKSDDLKLLLHLIATKSGIAPCLRLLCLFDEELLGMAEVQNLKINKGHQGQNAITTVEFDYPLIMTEKIKELFSFTVEIRPYRPYLNKVH